MSAMCTFQGLWWCKSQCLKPSLVQIAATAEPETRNEHNTDSNIEKLVGGSFMSHQQIHFSDAK